MIAHFAEGPDSGSGEVLDRWVGPLSGVEYVRVSWFPQVGIGPRLESTCPASRVTLVSDRDTEPPTSLEQRGLIAYESLLAKLGHNQASLAYLSTLVTPRKVSP